MQGPALRLDRTRKHASVHGEVAHGLAYKQDGLPFNALGELIPQLVATKEQKALVEKRIKKLANKAAPAQPETKTDADNPIAENSAVDEEGDGDTDDDVNFDAWARGQERVEWTALQKAARKRFSKVFKSKEDIVEFLVFDAKILALEDVTPNLRPKGE